MVSTPRIRMEHPDAEFIPRVLHITPAIEAMAGGVSSEMGSGGMQTKIAAAKIAVGAGSHLCIAKGAFQHPLEAYRGGRAMYLVRAFLDSLGHPKAVDRGDVEAGRGNSRR